MERGPIDDAGAGLRRALRSVAVVVSVLVLLAVVTIASAGPRGDAGGRTGASTRFVDYATSAAVVIWIAMAALFLYSFVVFRDQIVERRLRSSRSWTPVKFFVMSMIVVGALFFARSVLHRNPLDALNVIRPHAPAIGKHGKTKTTRPANPEFHAGPVIVLGVGALLLVAALGAGAYLARRNRGDRDERIAAALADVVDDALGDLRSEPDARKAIIGAYARMERLLGAHGRPRDPSEAPFEFLGRVLRELRVTRRPAQSLTELFERAKFSTHPLDASSKERAIEALEAVRDELRDPKDVAADRAAATA